MQSHFSCLSCKVHECESWFLLGEKKKQSRVLGTVFLLKHYLFFASNDFISFQWQLLGHFAYHLMDSVRF